jgi:molybdopterin/thiamine biosynthesis adenylyltransferase/rhodanese-related sulfurtransferase
MSRYDRQLALPDFTQAHQDFLKGTKLLMVGAGGLGAAALPYLAGAGIGSITIVDDDVVDVTNLHRQTIFKEKDAGKNKAELAAHYIRELNPDIEVTAVAQRLGAGDNAEGFDVILDGTDNFEAKQLLNEISIKTKTPLVAASVDQFNASVAVFAGFDKQSPCYHCLFPELPTDCKTCVEGGILGTVPGLAGMYQAHMTLLFLIGEIQPGTVLSLDFKTMRTSQLKLEKNPECPVCSKANYGAKREPVAATIIPLVHPNELRNHVIVDVRSDVEVSMAPIEGALHIRLDTIPERYEELPKDKLLAFVCSANIRSRKAAEYVYACGYKNVCVMDALAS